MIMTTREHYAIYESLEDEFVVTVKDVVVATSTNVIQLDEFHPKYEFNPVYYFPNEALNRNYIQPNEHRTTCPIKGEASYWNLVIGEEVFENAVWGYEKILETAIPIKGYVAFDLSKGVKITKNEVRILKQGYKGKKQ